MLQQVGRCAGSVWPHYDTSPAKHWSRQKLPVAADSSRQGCVEVLHTNDQGYRHVVVVSIQVLPLCLLIVVSCQHVKDKPINVSQTVGHFVTFLNVF